MVWSLIPADPPCAYVLGQIGSITVATPARVVFVPPEEAEAQPVRVHLDEAGGTILGYSLRAPGTKTGPEAAKVFVPGPPPETAPTRSSLLEVEASLWTCSSEGTRTRAIPVRVPASMFERPGTVVEVASIALHLSHRPVARPGHVILLEGGGLLVIPLPGHPSPLTEEDVTEPFITVYLGSTVWTARYLSPLPDTAPAKN
jgi:hypothetical protein